HHFKRYEWNAGFSRRVACVADEKYVLRHELEQTKGNLHKRINQVDSKHDSKHSDLKLLLHTFMESQKPLGKSLQNIEGEMKTLNTTMSGYNTRITDIEYEQKVHHKLSKRIEDAQKRKKEHNTK